MDIQILQVSLFSYLEVACLCLKPEGRQRPKIKDEWFIFFSLVVFLIAMTQRNIKSSA